ncbi:cilia- and flagella-associated protein 157-like [Pomacea canaliculata]|uniref:cilia- and flagella-associated protein 157-like n=1 Tax=Pomacea canaliculata TaxID=400727 RepID=UPI000D738291|nr:cilia- and flagella-associated protein 157-like [Pomacea canaliculata]
MPPKKKSGKGGKKEKKGEKSKSARPTRQAGEPLGETSKAFYLLQIRDLENRLARYQRKCDELEVGNGQFNEKFVQLETDKKEVVGFWKRQVETKTDEIADLNDRYIGLQQTRENEKEQFELQIQQQRNEYQEMKDTLTSENMILGGKLASLEEFKVQKDDLMAKFAMLEEELKKKQQDHEEDIYNLEKKAVIDKDRLKKEMILRVNQVAAEFRKVSNKQMAETTKRTIRENVSITTQLAKMSDKTMEILQENEELRNKEKQYKQQIELMEVNEKELAKKNHSSQKIIRMLTEKCRHQEEEIAAFEQKEQEHQQVLAEVNMLQEQVTFAQEETKQVVKVNEELSENLRSTSRMLENETDRRKCLEHILGQTSQVLKEALRRTRPAYDEPDTSLTDVEQRNHLLQQLLMLLNSAASAGLGPKPGELGKQYEETSHAIIRMPGHDQFSYKSDLSALGSIGAIPHYNLGDLGLVPRPSQAVPTFTERVHGLSATTHLRSLRKVLTRSVGVQTVSTPKALFYADQLLSQAPKDPTNKEKTELIHSPPVLGPITSSKTLTNKAF